MGRASRPLRVHARGYAELARVDILRDGGVVHAVRGEPPLPPGSGGWTCGWSGAQADTTTRWDGRLSVTGGRLVLPEFVGPEVVAHGRGCRGMGAHHAQLRRALRRAARRRRGQRLRPGRRAGALSTCAGRSVRIGLAELADRLAGGPFVPRGRRGAGLPGELALQPAVGALLGLGARELDVAFDDDEALTGAAFYYARVFQVDGEMAWSSPIWVRTT